MHHQPLDCGVPIAGDFILPSSSPGHLFKSRDRDEYRRMMELLLGFQNSLPFYIYSAPSHTTLFISGPRLEIWSSKKGLRNELGRLLAPQRAA